MTRTRSNGRIVALSGILLLLAVTSSPLFVAGHGPANMNIEYAFDTQILSVAVTHLVSDPSTHYIENITVYKNDAKIASRTYTSQESTTTASDTFGFEADVGDEIRVTAECNQGGSAERTLTVVDSTSTSTTTSTTTSDGAFDSSLVIFVAVAVLLVIAIVVKVTRSR